MAAATQDRRHLRQKGEYKDHDVAASKTIYAGTMVMNNLGHATEGGYAQPAADQEFAQFIGVAENKVTCGTTAGDAQVKLRTTGVYSFLYNGTPHRGLIGLPVAIMDDQTVGLMGTSDTDFNIPAGYISDMSEVHPTTEVLVNIDAACGWFPKYLMYPVAGTTEIARGDLVCENTAGYAVPGADTANYKFLGICIYAADNNPGNAGDISVKVVPFDIIQELTHNSFADAYIGDQAYVAGAQAIDEAACTGNADQYCGRIIRMGATTTAFVLINALSEAAVVDG
jgi:hypothetical protein